MPKPTSKTALIETSQHNYKVLMSLVNSYSVNEANKEFPEGPMFRNIRDVLAHLHHWHLMLLEWYRVGTKGEKPDMPAKGYTWKTLPELNRKIWESYLEVDLYTVKESLSSSYSKVQDLINAHSETELFQKKRYQWTGSTSLGAYLFNFQHL